MLETSIVLLVGACVLLFLWVLVPFGHPDAATHADDPIGELASALEAARPPPIAWVVLWSRDGDDPVALAWRHSEDGQSMARLLLMVGQTHAVWTALSSIRPVSLPFDRWWFDDRWRLGRAVRRLRRFAASASDHSAHVERFRAEIDGALWDADSQRTRHYLRRALARSMRTVTNAPPTLSDLMQGAGIERST